MKTEQEYQKAIELSLSQKRAWSQLVRAINRCRKENIFFYQTLETLGGLNGDNVHAVCGNDDKEFRRATSSHPGCLQFKHYPTVGTACSFADDDHFIELKEDW